MAVTSEDLYEILRKLRMDLSDAQSKITSIFQVLTELHIPDVPTQICGKCGAEFPGERTLSEHLYISHAGAEPEHWKDPVSTETGYPSTPKPSTRTRTGAQQ